MHGGCDTPILADPPAPWQTEAARRPWGTVPPGAEAGRLPSGPEANYNPGVAELAGRASASAVAVRQLPHRVSAVVFQ